MKGAGPPCTFGHWHCQATRLPLLDAGKERQHVPPCCEGKQFRLQSKLKTSSGSHNISSSSSSKVIRTNSSQSDSNSSSSSINNRKSSRCNNSSFNSSSLNSSIRQKQVPSCLYNRTALVRLQSQRRREGGGPERLTAFLQAWIV